LLDRLGDALDIIPNSGFPIQVNPSIAQSARQESSVRIDDIAEKDFRSDGNDF
jgi:hypothetical protein